MRLLVYRDTGGKGWKCKLIQRWYALSEWPEEDSWKLTLVLRTNFPQICICLGRIEYAHLESP